jgi:type I restriction enzyme M protein
MSHSQELAGGDTDMAEAIGRGFIQINGRHVQYNLHQKKVYNWGDPEELIRAQIIAFLILSKKYPAHRIKTQVAIPRHTPQDWAEIVVYADDDCTKAYLVVKVQSPHQTAEARDRAIEQLLSSASTLQAPYGLYDAQAESLLFDVKSDPAVEPERTHRGGRSVVPAMYGQIPAYEYIAGSSQDTQPVEQPDELETRIRRIHSIIWAGGKRDPLLAFDEWSKLLFAKVVDERTTETHKARSFQVGTNESAATVASRVRSLFQQGCQHDPKMFPVETPINLPDKKVYDVVKQLQSVSLTRTDIDAVGIAFENFFGSMFRGEHGQYFTMRQIARFTVAMLDIRPEHFVIDPTAGSGGFLLEALLQVWRDVNACFVGQDQNQIARIKHDFAAIHVFGIEIHKVLARVCKINLLLHHDGHTHVEAGRSCLDSTFSVADLQDWKNKFHRVIGNPPFGDDIKKGDEDSLGTNSLEQFVVARNRDAVPSEHVIVERAVDMLQPNGWMGLVLPDGLLNNRGELSNCPWVRTFLAMNGHVAGIVSLPDFAFRKSGAQNKTSLLFFRKFTLAERRDFLQALGEESNIATVYRQPRFRDLKTFLAEANYIGYTPAGAMTDQNDLYNGAPGGRVHAEQARTILGEWRLFKANPNVYAGRKSPDCSAVSFADMWDAHPSHRIDPKYHLFKRSEHMYTPPGWIRVRIGDAMRRRQKEVDFAQHADRRFVVITLSQTGEIRPREPGKSRNPPEWRASYLENGSSRWFQARAGDIVYSSIDLWKGCIAVVPPELDGAIATSEFPILEISDPRLDAEFLSYLLRSRHYQRAFRAITTGHSNRRRTQAADFDDLEICFPADLAEQHRIVAGIRAARRRQRDGAHELKVQMANLSDRVDGRMNEELPAVMDEPEHVTNA